MCPNPQETANLVTFTEEILNGELHFLCSGYDFTGYDENTYYFFIKIVEILTRFPRRGVDKNTH